MKKEISNILAFMSLLPILFVQSGLSQIHKTGNIGINGNFVFPNIYNFLLLFYYILLVNVELDVGGYKNIIFQGCRLH